MSRSFDFVVSGVSVTIAVVVHRMAVELFAPNAPLHKLASDGTGALNGAARADLWFQILAIWMPLAVFGGIALLYPLIREFRRQANTATTRPR